MATDVARWRWVFLLVGLVVVGCTQSAPKPPPAAASSARKAPPPPPPPAPVASNRASPLSPLPPPAAANSPSTAATPHSPNPATPPASPRPAATSVADVVVPPVTSGQPPPITLARGATGDLPPGLKGSPIQARQGEKFLWAPYPSTCLAVINDGEEARVWDVAAGKQIGRPLTGLVRSSKSALSPDGRRLALIAVVGKQSGAGIWSTETGKSAANWQYDDKARYSDWVRFAGPDKLLIAKPEVSQSVIQVWDAAAGKPLGEITGPAYVREEAIAVSADGSRLAAFHSFGTRRVTVYDIASGAVLAELPVPGTSPNCEGLAFSAGGEELAGLFSSGGQTTLISWVPDKREEVLQWTSTSVSQSGVKGGGTYQGPAIEWLPDRSGFLLFGHYLVDRQSQRLVWTIHSPDDDLLPAGRRFIDNDRLAVSTGPGQGVRRVQMVLLPWKRINASLAALAGDAPAVLKPGQSVTLEIEMGELRGGTVEATRDALAEAVAESLAEQRIVLAEDAPVVLLMKYREEKGEELEEVARGNGPGGLLPPPGGSGVTGTGRKLLATHIVCDLSLRRADKPTVLWSNKIEFNPLTLSIRGDFSDAAARESSLRMVAHALSRQAFPYFLSADEGLSPLPGLTKLPGGANRAGVKVRPKK